MVRESGIAMLIQSKALGRKQRTSIRYFQKREDRHVQLIIPRIKIKLGRRKLLMQEVSAKHHGLVLLHIGGRGMQ